jgi:Tfp pilus assembly protein FimV
MSVATQLAPTDYAPPSRRHRALYVPPPSRRRHEQLATVFTLHPPTPRSVAPPLRLTRRGVVVLSVVVALCAAGLVWLAWLSAPAAPSRAAGPSVVTVQSGDTLWSIATRVAPDRDPQAEIARLQRVNHLSGVDLVPGQVLRVR